MTIIYVSDFDLRGSGYANIVRVWQEGGRP